MVSRIIISDWSCLEDLIIFENDENLVKIQSVIQKVKDTIEDYTSDDIFNALKENFKIKEIIDLASTSKFIY